MTPHLLPINFIPPRFQILVFRVDTPIQEVGMLECTNTHHRHQIGASKAPFIRLTSTLDFAHPSTSRMTAKGTRTILILRLTGVVLCGEHVLSVHVGWLLAVVGLWIGGTGEVS